ncbi:threonylcarbamoyl-AMP synthase [Brachybacterium halotolerans subsp. kimchii]|uniref:L-threonylcarbamoyladenylate synthase n=1 Tax=Brachybacterium halotolerans TaxID=2795215 RepID=UPI001E57B901|nr:L-threonylcarbamoyladenylate synthase [Brachybacterium halotolerans]UEJ82872.1 threonylcarbamoyl-AMP synthase [Brachybacterium halotolerans subsp. kimchii]
MSVYDTTNEATRDEGLQAAQDALSDGGLIVLPTDTVYGIGADAFTPDAVQALLDAKDRGRDAPPPVLVGDPAVLLGLAVDVPEYAERLTEAFWPGALTLILTAQPSLNWDLGETRGTVALRMPDDEVTLELLRRTGPLAVSSANRHGKPAALSIMDAATQLGDRVDVYLDGGPARLGTASTIIDTTVEPAEIVREGALTREQIIEAVGDIFTAPEPEEPEAGSAAETEADGGEVDSDADETATDANEATAEDAPAEGATDAETAADESAATAGEENVEDIGADAFAAAGSTPLVAPGESGTAAADVDVDVDVVDASAADPDSSAEPDASADGPGETGSGSRPA